MSALSDLTQDQDAAALRNLAGAASAFGVLGGPAAWFVQLCGGYLLASGPCFPGSVRYLAPPHSQSWTWPALMVLMVVCALIALGAFAVSWRIYRESQPAGREKGTGRESFMALWGMLLGAGFCVATLLTSVAFITLPRCAG